MAAKPTVEEALRYCENSKIADPYILLEVLFEEVKRLRGIVGPHHTVQPSGQGSWLVIDTRPAPRQRSNWAIEADAVVEAKRLDTDPNSPST